MTILVVKPNTPVISRNNDPYPMKDKLKGLNYGPDTAQGQAHSYGVHSPLEIPVLEKPPGSNLPAPIRTRVTSRDCFIVHSD